MSKIEVDTNRLPLLLNELRLPAIALTVGAGHGPAHHFHALWTENYAG